MSYVTCQIRPTPLLKALGYQTKKFAIECETALDVYAVCANINSLDGISYINVRHSKPKKGTITLSSKGNYIKHLHL